MIPVFRKLRKKMADDNKPLMYMRYAVGEILLIVLGILIALQLDNWNQNRELKKVEQIYLLALQNEFKKNEDILDTTISLNKEIIKGTETLLSFFDIAVFDTLSQKTISHNISQAMAAEIYYNPSTGVITEIISSGNLKLIKNQELKQKLASFGNTLELLKHQENEVLRHRHILEELHASGGNVGKMFSDVGLSFGWKSRFEEVSSFDLFTFLPFENRLFLFRGTSRATDITFYQPLKEEIESILKIIENELEE